MKIRLAVIHFGFALTGVVTTLLGPALPLLAVQWRLDDAQSGRLFVAQFVSGVAGSLIASRVLMRCGAVWTVTSGMFMIGVGVLGAASTDLVTGLMGICLFGLGLGFALPATNLFVAEIVPEQRVAALNLLNFSWTAGALAGPLMISWTQASLGLKGFLWFLATALAIVTFVEIEVLPKALTRSASYRAGKLDTDKRMLFAVLTCGFLILYVGVENGFSGWLSSLSIRLHQTSPATTAMVQSSFWGAILLGRLAAPLVIRFMPAGQLVFAGLATSAIGIAATISARSVAMLEAGVLLCGFGLAALFPTAVAIFTEWYGTGGGGTIVLGLCGLGGALIPSLVGFVALHSHSLRIGLAVTLSCVLLGFVAFWRMQALVKPESRA